MGRSGFLFSWAEEGSTRLVEGPGGILNGWVLVRLANQKLEITGDSSSEDALGWTSPAFSVKHAIQSVLVKYLQPGPWVQVGKLSGVVLGSKSLCPSRSTL